MGKDLKGKEPGKGFGQRKDGLYYKQDEWCAGPPKTESSYRTIPLTDTAYNILRLIYDTREYRREADALSTVLTFMDRKTGQKRKLVISVQYSCLSYKSKKEKS